MSAENSIVEAELRVMGATHPSLWIALFHVNQAIHSSKPLPKIAEWNFVCNTVQDLYRMSAMDAREFAVAQTLTSIMHQEQVKEEIVNRFAVNAKDTTNVTEAYTQTTLPELSEIQRELDQLSQKANELAESYAKISKLIEDVGGAIQERPDEADGQSLIISSDTIETIEAYLQNSFNTCYPKPALIAKKFELNPQWVFDELSKASDNCPKNISPAVIFILFLMLHSKGDLRHHQTLYDTALSLRSVNPAFLPTDNIYDEIRRAISTNHMDDLSSVLEGSFRDTKN